MIGHNSSVDSPIYLSEISIWVPGRGVGGTRRSQTVKKLQCWENSCDIPAAAPTFDLRHRDKHKVLGRFVLVCYLFLKRDETVFYLYGNREISKYFSLNLRKYGKMEIYSDRKQRFLFLIFLVRIEIMVIYFWARPGATKSTFDCEITHYFAIGITCRQV